jgi:hypothetical protein
MVYTYVATQDTTLLLLLLLHLLLLPFLHVYRSTCQQYWWERFPADGGASVTSYMFTFTDPAPANKDLLPAMMQQYERGLEKYLGGLWRFITSPLLSYTLCVCMLCMQACVWHGVHNYNMHASHIVYLCVSADICCVPQHGQPSAATCVHISVCVWGGCFVWGGWVD